MNTENQKSTGMSVGSLTKKMIDKFKEKGIEINKDNNYLDVIASAVIEEIQDNAKITSEHDLNDLKISGGTFKGTIETTNTIQ